MSEQESFRATHEAKSAVVRSSAPLSRHDAALQRYLGASQHKALHDPGWDEWVGPPPIHSVAPKPAELKPIPAEITRQPRADVVVAGLDGSAHAAMAARWAAFEADSRGAALRLVYAYSVPVASYAGYSMAPEDLGDVLRAEGDEMLAGVADEIRSRHPDLQVDTRLVQGDAVLALRRESARARLTVVGSRGNGRMAGVLLGSVAMAVAAHGTAPVAVVPTEGPGWPHDGAVVVGVDGSDTNEVAVRFAFEQAAIRGAELVAVRTWNHPKPSDEGILDLPAMDRAERTRLADDLARWHDKYPDVVVRQQVLRGKATAMLLSLARTAQLLVVGSRGRGGFAGMVLGSTSQSLISHAVCPVVVVRPDSLD
jgi:nucleotide-binding universal stress UspA family protein